MRALDQIAERRIAEAIERGELSRLPGEGKPLDLDDDRLVPEEVRAVYRVLKNAGFVPPEIASRCEIATLEAAIRERAGETLADEAQRRRALTQLALLKLRIDAQYRDQVITRLAGRG
ncbi:MAG: DnaJ family domain-containing protein [Betaproteobacteria bacterium]